MQGDVAFQRASIFLVQLFFSVQVISTFRTYLPRDVLPHF